MNFSIHVHACFVVHGNSNHLFDQAVSPLQPELYQSSCCNERLDTVHRLNDSATSSWFVYSPFAESFILKHINLSLQYWLQFIQWNGLLHQWYEIKYNTKLYLKRPSFQFYRKWSSSKIQMSQERFFSFEM